MPHIHCYLGQTALIWTMFTTDLAIGIAYLTIATMLWRLITQIQLRFTSVILCFGVFIAACGGTHFLEVYNLWVANYWATAAMKAVTAIASVGTAFYLYRLRPSLIALAHEVGLSEQRQNELEALNEELDQRVRERTGRLEEAWQQLSVSETRMRRALMDMPFPIMMHAEGGEIMLHNREWERRTGFAQEHAKEMAEWDALQGYVDQVYHDEKVLHANEIRVTTRQRETRIWDLTVIPLGTLRDGRRTGLSLARDVTEECEQAEALASSEGLFRSLANSIPQLAWMTDKQGSFSWFNERWYNYTGTAQAEVSGSGWTAVVHPDHVEKVTASFTRAINAGLAWEETFPIRSKMAQWRWFLSRARPIRDAANEIVMWFGTNTDITENLRAEQELIESKEVAVKANLAKTQFLANMSHEIRTPVGAIMGFAEFLKNPATTPTDRLNYAAIIERNSQHLLRLIDDILDLSKVEAGRIAIERIDFSLTAFLADLKAIAIFKAEAKGVYFALQIPSRIPDHICTDALRLKQILMNIIGNAIKFTESGRVELTVTYASGALNFVVTDTGPGISAEAEGKLFQPFSQADPSMTRKYGGTGLGLILSKRLCVALGGDLTLVRSEVGSGSEFLVSIRPQVSARAGLVGEECVRDCAGAEPAATPDKRRLAGLRVLVVEDSPDNQMLIEMYLSHLGAVTEMADDGLEGVEKATTWNPDLVLMDVQMPRLDGHQATRRLRELGFKKPIVALTAHAMREERDKCFESGCNDYLTKPINRARFTEVLVRYRPNPLDGAAELLI